MFENAYVLSDGKLESTEEIQRLRRELLATETGEMVVGRLGSLLRYGEELLVRAESGCRSYRDIVAAEVEVCGIVLRFVRSKS